MPNWRYHQITTDAQKSATLDFMSGIGAPGGFTVPLSATGLAPATHWGQSIQLTESQRQAIDAATGTTYPADSFWWRCDAARLAAQQLLRDDNNPDTPGADIGQPFGFADAKAVMGLVAVTP